MDLIIICPRVQSVNKHKSPFAEQPVLCMYLIVFDSQGQRRTHHQSNKYPAITIIYYQMESFLQQSS